MSEITDELNFVSGAMGIFAMLAMLSFAVTPVAESNTFYSYTTRDNLANLTGDHSGVVGCAQEVDGHYIVHLAKDEQEHPGQT